MDKQDYIEKVNAAKQHSYNYYVLSAPTISDVEFDLLVAEIEAMEQAHPDWTLPDSPTQQVGSDLGGTGRRLIRHRTPMLSCQKAQNTDKVQEWLDKLTKKLGYTPEVMLSLKADGISCSLVYQDGQLIEASSRGDGPTGQDLLQHVKLMENVPQETKTICDPDSGTLFSRVEVRGEIVCPIANLEGLTDRNGKQYADCRSAASSICNQVSASEDCKKLMFLPWDVIIDNSESVEGLNNQSDMTRLLKGLGFGDTCYTDHDNGKHVKDYLEFYGKNRSKCSIPIDGVVIRINDNKVFAEQGFTDHHPKGSIAYKFPPQTTTTRVRKIEISVGETGRRTPVAWFEPVTLLGRTVEKASLGSEDKMRELGVTEGCTVEVGLSNDVTPKIYRVV